MIRSVQQKKIVIYRKVFQLQLVQTQRISNFKRQVGMTMYLFPRNPQFLVMLKNLIQKLKTLQTERNVQRPYPIPTSNSFKEILIVFRVKRMKTSNQTIVNCSKCPHVCLIVVSLLEKMFRRHLQRSSDYCEGSLIFLKLSSKSEIGQLHNKLFFF